MSRHIATNYLERISIHRPKFVSHGNVPLSEQVFPELPHLCRFTPEKHIKLGI